ncbi:putative ribonuclease H-like domain-containing protein [Tanacetum coccineum]
MARSNDENPPPPPPQTSTQQAPHTVSTIKLHILKRGEYDIWAMKMEHYLSHTDYPIWEVIQKGNGPVNVSTDTNGSIKILVVRMNQRVAEVQFKSYVKAFLIQLSVSMRWQIKSSFGLYLLLVPSILSVMRTKPRVDSLSFDDLYNNLRVFKSDVKGSTRSSSSAQNVAFVSSESTSSTNDVSTAYGDSTSAVYNSQRENSSSYTDELTRDGLEMASSHDFNKIEEVLQEDSEQREQLGDASIEIQAYTQALAKKLLAEAVKEKEELKTKLENFQSSSKGRSKLLNSQMSTRDKYGLGYGDQACMHFPLNDRKLSCLQEHDVNFSHLIGDCGCLLRKRMETAVLTRTGKIPVSTARASGTNNVSTARHNFNSQAILTNAARKISTVKPFVNRVNTAEVNAVNAVGEKRETTVKPSADYPHRTFQNKGIVNSGCSRHMTGNKAYLAEYQDFNGGPVAFGGSKGYITGKGKIKTGKLDFEDLPDANQVLLRIPRQNNMYSFNLENIVPSRGLACLIAKATIDESNKWHRRLGHVNFKNLNKLVKGNLVRGLPSKIFQNDHTCVACQKGKQHKASCKAKSVSSISQPLQLLHMDLFGPTSVRSLNHKTYCLVITDDFSRFSWVFFLRTKDETSGILKDFIRQIENQLNQKVKTIRCDNGTEFKNRDFIEFCGSKGIKREYSNARTPQQNGVAERKNRTLIEAARTMLADSFLPNTFWAEAVSTACYVLNRVLVTKPQNKTPYELITGKIPIISYIRPFGCHVTILNTIDHLGKFDGKSDEGFLVGYSLQSKAFRVYNLETKRVEENLHITFLENKPNVAGKGPTWLFDLDYLTDSMNYQPVRSENQANKHAGPKEANHNAEGLKKESNGERLPKVWSDAPIIEEYESGNEDEHVSLPSKEQETPSFAFINTVKHVKTPRQTVIEQNTCSQSPKPDEKDCSSLMSKKLGLGFRISKGSSQREIRPVWNNVQRMNHQNQFVPKAAVPINAARKVNIVKPIVNNARPKDGFYKSVLPFRKSLNRTTTLRTNFSKQKVNTAKVNAVSVVKGKRETAVKSSACSNWSPKDITGTKSPNTIVDQVLEIVLVSKIHQADSSPKRLGHMTGNKAYLAEYQDFNGGPVAFKGSKCYITGNGKIKAGKLDFEDVCFVKELQHFNLFSVSQMCDKKNKVPFTDSECLVLSPEFKSPDKNQVLLRIPRQNNMYSFNLESIVPSRGLACLITKATFDESNKWHRRSKGIKREYSNARTPQQNGVAKRKNRTLIEAARTMLADSFLPNTFWAEAVSTACYVLNRVLVTKPQNKTPYELITGKIPIISYIRPFGCHVTILNTIDHLGRFESKSDEEFLVGYSLNSKAFRVYNLETKRVEENLQINFLENKPSVARKGPNWLFDLDYLTDSMNYQPVRSENQANKTAGPEEANNSSGTQDNIDPGNFEMEVDPAHDYFVLPIYSSYTSTVKSSEAKNEGEKSNKDTGLKINEEPVDQEDQAFLEESRRMDS